MVRLIGSLVLLSVHCCEVYCPAAADEAESHLLSFVQISMVRVCEEQAEGLVPEDLLAQDRRGWAKSSLALTLKPAMKQ